MKAVCRLASSFGSWGDIMMSAKAVTDCTSDLSPEMAKNLELSGILQIKPLLNFRNGEIAVEGLACTY
jgi:fatty acid-binding protein DegV